jgi:hypothetical protein
MKLNMKPLRRAFSEMRRYGILAEENLLCCQSCACSEMESQAEEFPEDSKPVGYCFWHGQDHEELVTSGRAMLAFNGFGATDSRAVGHIVVGCLKRAGVRAKWDGSVSHRIEFWLTPPTVKTIGERT